MDLLNMKNISEFSADESRKFIDSFDHFLFDCDGVLYLSYRPLPNVGDALNRLKSLHKKVHFVTNNSSEPMSKFVDVFKSMNVETSASDFKTPYLSLDHYLKSINFNRKIYLIGTKNTHTFLEQLGYQVFEQKSDQYSTFDELMAYLPTIGDVGALVVDFDLQLNYLKLMVAKVILSNENTLFLSLMKDKDIPLSPTFSIIGPGYFVDMLQSISKRTVTNFGKPDVPMKKYLLDNLKITDPSRVLFIGDSLDSDMVFADLCQFKKMLVLSGTTKPKDLENLTDPVKTPHYYANGVKDLWDLLNKI